MVAVAKRPKKASKKSAKPKGKVLAKAKRPTAPPAKASKNGKPTNGKMKHAGPGKFAPAQKPLASMEDVDTRIPELDEKCQKAIADRERKQSAGQDFAESLEAIGVLLKEHNLECYIISGRKFFIEPGEPHVKVQKVTQ